VASITLEHVLSALNGLCIDNSFIEIHAEEPPVLDGSAKYYANLLCEAESVELDAERKIFELQVPISVTEGNRSLITLPYNGFKISCTSANDRGIHTQHLSLDITPENDMSDIAPARTFAVDEDIEPLLQCGKIQAASRDSAILIKDDQILSKEPLRFSDEFVRHKMLDIMGDMALLGMDLRCHIIAVRPGHALDVHPARKIAEQYRETHQMREPKSKLKTSIIKNADFDIVKILNTLPHRSPFILVDRVIEFIDDDSI
jgi:UDP-3-O-[3-hydroxymyristoyl] N-acetylglucosamine deacetylase/3-hydroxyacyl-[acyl-carrier-protein] dehydratase